MKKTANHFRILILFGMLFAFTKCEESELQIEGTNLENNGFKQLNFDELPVEISQEFVSQSIPLNRAGTIARNQRPSFFGVVKRDKVNRVKRKNGSISYTATLEKTSKGLYYDNIVVQQDSLGNTERTSSGMNLTENGLKRAKAGTTIQIIRGRFIFLMKMKS